MSKMRMATIREYSMGDLQGRIRESRGELAKLMVISAKGTLKKDSGRLRPLRRDIARMETRMSELRREMSASPNGNGRRPHDD